MSDTLHNPTAKAVPRTLIKQPGQLVGTVGSANSSTSYQPLVEATLHELFDYEPVDDFAELQAAVALGRPVEIRELIPVTAATTIATRFKVHDGAGLDVAVGIVLTVDGTPVGVSPRQQIFFGTGSSGQTTPGQVVGKLGDVDRFIDWFGAQPVASYDSSDAINSALKAFSVAAPKPVTVRVPAETYYIGKSIDMTNVSNYGTALRGYGRATSVIKALSTFSGAVTASSDYASGTKAMVLVGTTSVAVSSFGIDISNIQFNGFAYVATRLSIIYQPFFTQEFFNIEDCSLSGYSGYGIGIGAADEQDPVNRPDINNCQVSNCEIHDAQPHSFADGAAIPVNVQGGRNFVLTRCTVFGYSDPNARTDATKWLPAVIKIRNANFTISNLHTEGGAVVFDLYEKYQPASVLPSQSGGNISSCDAIRFGTHIRINDNAVALTVTQTRGTYNAASGATSPPYPTAPTAPRFIYDVPRAKDSAGYQVVNGSDRGIGFYSRIYQNQVGHPFSADSNYATGTRVVTNHLELQ